MHNKPYKNLLIMGLLHLPVMYAIMFAMVDRWEDVRMNLNTFYMALMMVAPMLIMMPLTMMSMYPDSKKNIIVFVSSAALLFVSYFFIRKQTLIGDKQFIQSMIPHHSGAILMCKASINDSELKDLCEKISNGQRAEIEQMNRILERLKNR